MSPSSEIISSNSGKMTPFMKLSWEQQKRLFTSSSSWARYHPVIIRFCLSATAKSPSVQEHLRNTNILRLTSERTLRDVIKTTSGYNGADRFVTLLFDEMKIKENLILVEHRELHWFY